MVHATRLLQFSQQFRKFCNKQFTPLLEETGLSMREFHVLLFLINNPGYDTARDITEFRGLAKSQVSQAVELLCAKDLLQRMPDSTDRRVVHLTLTSTGQALAQQAQVLQSRCYSRLLAGFTPQEEAQFHALLSRVLDNGETLETDSTQERNLI